MEKCFPFPYIRGGDLGINAAGKVPITKQQQSHTHTLMHLEHTLVSAHLNLNFKKDKR